MRQSYRKLTRLSDNLAITLLMRLNDMYRKTLFPIHLVADMYRNATFLYTWLLTYIGNHVFVCILSRYIVRNKSDYYRLLQKVRDEGAWEEWVLFMLEAVESTSRQTISIIESIRAALLDYKHRIRAKHKFYSQDLINNLFYHPYTKVDFLMRDLSVSRITATKYLEALTADGLLLKEKIGRSNFYINQALYGILTKEM